MSQIRLPQVDKVLRQPVLEDLQKRVRRDVLAALVREFIAELRAKESLLTSFDEESIANAVAQRVHLLLEPGLRKLINATGVILNTNLGRAPISKITIEDAIDEVAGYCNLEIDLATGKRGKRSQRIERLLQLLTGCESGIVVNNNAAAVLLCVNAFARGREVVVSRGELIEIGGSFRLPDVIESAGSLLREVGTTNKTRISDFDNAISARTGLLMRCHRSNFEIRGFTESATMAELAELSKKSGVPLLDDMGSGVLIDLSESGLKDEPTVQASVGVGCGLVSFSGDKLLGGPQAGIIIGQRNLIDILKKHPIYRALRPDKLTLALLERTLIAYLDPNPRDKIPTLRLIFQSVSDIKNRAEEFASSVLAASEGQIKCAVIETHGAAGGGALPGETLASFGVVLSINGIKPMRLAEMLRKAETPVVATVQDDKVVVDFRALDAGDQQLLLKSVLSLLLH